MVEIRAIQEDEASCFLQLLCEIFELDHGRAATVFYSEPFFDLKRKWGLFENGHMVSILTTTPLHFGFGDAIGIAGVGTLPTHRQKGYGQQLLEHVLQKSESNGEKSAILFAHQEVLYARSGFQTIDQVIKGPIKQTCQLPYTGALPEGQVQEIYSEWSSQNPLRLKRDSRRWRYWRYVYRECYAVPGGYVASETNLCREAIFDQPIEEWPLMPNADWYGLRTMTESLRIPLKSESVELLVMARNFPDVPQIFMTDQF